MPALSPTMAEGSIVNWLVKEGDKVGPGDILCEVQTDKAVMGLEVDEDGILAKIIVKQGTDNVKIGDMIAIIASEDEDWKSVADSYKGEAKTEQASKTTESVPVPCETSKSSEASPSTSHVTKEYLIGPAAKNLIEKHHLNPTNISGTGPFNNILKSDVLEFIKSGNISTQPKTASSQAVVNEAASFIDIPLTSMRKTIANRLTESKTSIPHAYVTKEFSVAKLEKARQLLKQNNISLSLNDFIIKACSLALRMVPEMNSQASSDGSMKRLNSVDISIAVATPEGLITPIIFNSDIKSISEIASDAKSLVQKAKDKKLKPEEFMGGGFSISNLGMFGITEFTAIINPPQTGILACGSARESLRVDPTTKALEKDKLVKFSLSIDSRYIDEVTAGRFLSHVANFLGDSIISLFLDDQECRKIIKNRL